MDFNRPNLQDKIASNASNLIKASPRASEWAPRWTQSVLGAPFSDLKTRNNGETPERMGFVYEAPLRSGFFNADRIIVNTTAAGSPSVTYYDLAPYSLNNATTNIDNLQGRIVRGPTWDLYRNYYRMYKREVEAIANGSNLRGQPAPSDGNTFVARGVEPLSYATGNRADPLQKTAKAATDGKLEVIKTLKKAGYDTNPADQTPIHYADKSVAKNYFYRNNLSDGTAGPSFQADKRLLYPFGMPGGVTPSNSYSAFIRSGIADPTATAATPTSLIDNNYGGSAGMTKTTTTRPWPTSPALMPNILRFSLIFSAVRNDEVMGMYVDPIIVVHNPYDCAIEFEGIAMETNGTALPYIFTFYAPTPDVPDPGSPLSLGVPKKDGSMQFKPNWSYLSTENFYAETITSLLNRRPDPNTPLAPTSEAVYPVKHNYSFPDAYGLTNGPTRTKVESWVGLPLTDTLLPIQ
ncbi:MAG: hypothetical protein NTX20_06045 [Verrucomicrobia bacterium]|nr:hypothetical protein [Verrucomicrobiota bacterium]